MNTNDMNGRPAGLGMCVQFAATRIRPNEPNLPKNRNRSKHSLNGFPRPRTACVGPRVLTRA